MMPTLALVHIENITQIYSLANNMVIDYKGSALSNNISERRVPHVTVSTI